MKTETIPTREAVGFASCGVSTGGKFSDTHEAITKVLGWDVFTHELADRSVWERAEMIVRNGVPGIGKYGDDLRAICDDKSTSNDEKGKRANAVVALALSEFGPTVTLECGCDERTEHPLDSIARIAPGKPVIVLGHD